jgi:hypothetical protein
VRIHDAEMRQQQLVCQVDPTVAELVPLVLALARLAAREDEKRER